MGEVDVQVIAQRLNSLRKHLGERLGENLTLEVLASKSGVEHQKMVRIEHGKGSWESLIKLLVFYRTHGYNLDWILFPDNTNLPMILTSGDELLMFSELMLKVSNRLQEDYSQMTGHLRELGYFTLDKKRFTPSEVETPLPVELEL
ncbi:helix-turn-helix domain-containing protein [Spirosoma arcticum]|jgi:transcriptional regulator with XRE-family HTH domain